MTENGNTPQDETETTDTNPVEFKTKIKNLKESLIENSKFTKKYFDLKIPDNLLRLILVDEFDLTYHEAREVVGQLLREYNRPKMVIGVKYKRDFDYPVKIWRMIDRNAIIDFEFVKIDRQIGLIGSIFHDKGINGKDNNEPEAIKKMNDFLLNTIPFFTEKDTKQKEIWWYNAEKGIYHSHGEQLLERIIFRILPSLAPKRVAEIINKIRIQTYMKSKLLYQKKYIAFENVTVDMRTLEVIPHSPDHYCIVYSPVTFDKNADCPENKEAHRKWVSEEDIQTLEEVLGWGLIYGYIPKTMVMIVGDRDSGKSTFLDTLITLYGGTDNISSSSLKQLTESEWYTSNLNTSLYNIASELSSKTVKDVEILKLLVSGKNSLYGNIKFKSPQHFINHSKIIYETNEVPDFYNKKQSFTMKWLFLSFPHSFKDKERDLDYVDKLITKKELSGLLNLALEGARRLKERKFFEKDGYDSLKKHYKFLAQTDIIQLMLETNAFTFCDLEEEKEENFYITKDDLYIYAMEIYDFFSINNDNRLKKQQFCSRFIRRFKNMGVESSRKIIDGERKPVYKGVFLPYTDFRRFKKEVLEDPKEFNSEEGNFPLPHRSTD